MTARDALAQGRLHEALALQHAAVTETTDSATARLFLFELLTLSGHLAEARTELASIESTEASWPASRLQFRKLLTAIRHRELCRRPSVVATPPQHLKRRWRAAELAGHGESTAVEFADRADAAIPEILGFVDGREFAGLRDSDDRFAGVFEVLMGRHWVWVALEQIRTLKLSPVAAVLDVAYRPGELRLADGREFAVTVPLVYPCSCRQGDDFALGHTVDWQSQGGLTCGLGAKVLTAGEEELALGECTMFEVRSVR